MAEPQRVIGRPRVVAAATEPARREGTIAKLNRVVAGGGSALLITADGGRRPLELADGVELLDLQAAERSLGLNKVITRDPVRLLRRAQGKPIAGPSWAWARLSGSKPYRMVRPWLQWRALRHRLPLVRVGDVDHVLIVHQNSWPIAWQLHRLNPRVTISYEVPDELFTQHGLPIPPTRKPKSEPVG